MNEDVTQITEPPHPVKLSSRLENLNGKIFGRLAVIGRAPDYVSPKGQRCTMWVTRCECGADPKPVNARALKTGKVISCRCAGLEKIKAASTLHGMSHTVEHRAWIAMHRRCSDQNEKCYKNYGGRGIRVCDRWTTFLPFLEDMGKCPLGHSIERNDVDGNYTPDNCRWATDVEQARNTRRNHWLTINAETLCIAEWSERSGVKAPTIRYRLRAGQTAYSAVFTPVSK